MIAADSPDRSVVVASATAEVEARMKAQMIMAREFPRSLDAARAAMIRSCQRFEFAEKIRYQFPRGETTICDVSVVGMRELARLWGNIDYGFRVIADDARTRTIAGYAWDLETNGRQEQSITFNKLVKRKSGWVVPDERDLRGLTGTNAGYAVRNCIKSLIPKDLIDEILQVAANTIQQRINQDPDAARKEIADAFASLNVPIKELEEYIGHSLASCSPAELERLRGIWKAIRDGEEGWAKYYQREQQKTEQQNKGADAADDFGAGATAEQEQRPGSDKRPTLPTRLRKNRDDQRPIVDYLCALIPTVSATDRGLIADALPGLGMSGKDMMTVAKLLGETADESRGQKMEREPEPERESRQESEQAGKTNYPADIRKIVDRLEKTVPGISLDLLYKNWRTLLENTPAYAVYESTVEAFFSAKRGE